MDIVTRTYTTSDDMRASGLKRVVFFLMEDSTDYGLWIVNCRDELNAV